MINRELSQLGTGGAIRNSLNLFNSDHVLIMNGDSYIEFSVSNLIEFHNKHNADATILLSFKENSNEYGVVQVNKNNKIISFQEKVLTSNNILINAGVYYISKKTN